MFDMVRKKELDLTIPQYSEENEGKGGKEMKRPKNYYHYQLAGVVIHSGSSDSGHYYSFIKKRELIPPTLKRGSRSPSPSTNFQTSFFQEGPSSTPFSFPKASSSSWFSFNDSTVEPFDPSLIPDNCFGGVYPSHEWDEKTRSWKVFLFFFLELLFFLYRKLNKRNKIMLTFFFMIE
jgi:hypothetical protein